MVDAWFQHGSLSFALAAGLPSVLVAAAVGFLGWRLGKGQLEIAAEQRRIASAKLNFDLFEKRLAIFNATQTYLLHSMPSMERQGGPFIHLFHEASFLFGPEVEAYMRRAILNRAELADIAMRTKENGGEIVPKDAAREDDLFQWLIVEHDTGCRSVFGPYLDFGTWRQ